MSMIGEGVMAIDPGAGGSRPAASDKLKKIGKNRGK